VAAVAVWQADIAAAERDRAQIEAQRSAAVVTFLQDMLASADPAQAQGQALTVVELLDQARDALPASSLDLQARAAVEETLATTYNSLGRPEDGLPLAKEASERLRQELGRDHPLTLAAQHAEARFYIYLGEFEQAIDLLERTLAGRERVLGAHMDTASTLHNLAYAWAELGEVKRALEMDRRQLAIVEALAGADSQEALVTSSSIAQGLSLLGRDAEAEREFERILIGYRQHLGDWHPNTLSVMHNLAYLARVQGALERAEGRYTEVLALRRDVLGSTHLQTLNTVANLGSMYLDQGRLVEAAPLIDEAVESRSDVLGLNHPDTLASRVDQLRLALARNDSTVELDDAARLRDLTRDTLGADDPISRLAQRLHDELLDPRRK